MYLPLLFYLPKSSSYNSLLYSSYVSPSPVITTLTKASICTKQVFVLSLAFLSFFFFTASSTILCTRCVIGQSGSQKEIDDTIQLSKLGEDMKRVIVRKDKERQWKTARHPGTSNKWELPVDLDGARKDLVTRTQKKNLAVV